MDRDQIAEQTAAAEAADNALYEAEALEQVTAMPGLWYRPDNLEWTRYVVGCNGRVIGYLWPSAPGKQLGGWTWATGLDNERGGPCHTGRAAAAALAKSLGVGVAAT